MRVVGFSAILCLLVACATFPDKPKELNKNSKIGLVSLLGNKVNITKSVPFIFAVKSKDFDAVDWAVDREIEDMLVDGMQRSGYRSVENVKLPVDKKISKSLLVERPLFQKDIIEILENPTFLDELNKDEKISRNRYILFIVPSTSYIPNTYTLVKGYGYYSVGMEYIQRYISGGYALLDTKKGKVVGSWYGFIDNRSPIQTRNLTSEDKKSLYKFVIDGLYDKSRKEKYRNIIFEGELSYRDRQKLVEEYTKENGSLDTFDDQLYTLEDLMRPLHHTPENYEKLAPTEIKRLDIGLMNIEELFVKEIIQRLN